MLFLLQADGDVGEDAFVGGLPLFTEVFVDVGDVGVETDLDGNFLHRIVYRTWWIFITFYYWGGTKAINSGEDNIERYVDDE